MELYTSIKRKSQIWSIDLAIAFLIFLGGLIIFYKYSINSIDAEKEDIDDMVLDAKLLSNHLVSAGYPTDWDSSNVTQIGLTDGEMRIKKEKVEEFFGIADTDYPRSRRLLSTTHDYYVTFEDSEGNLTKIGGIEGIGKNYQEEDTKNIIRVVRFVYYNSSIIKLAVHIW